MEDTGVFICSSDSRRDVLDRVIPSVFKYWCDCPYPVYVGLNSRPDRLPPNMTAILAPVSDWRSELATQLLQMNHTRLIVLLDDYLLEARVMQERLDGLLATFERLHLQYLRLSPLGLSLLERIVRLGQRFPDDIRLISADRPFHSSLRIAIWQRQHLLAMLEKPGSIWDFEHQGRDGVRHFAIASRPPIRYQHLVEKGRWQPYARRLLRKAGLSDELGGRPAWPEWAYGRVWLDELRFFFHGIANH
jgi:hypothetical protein